MRHLLPPVFLGLALGLWGCAGDGPPVETTPATASTFARIQETIFNPQCATGSCHSSGANAGGLNLEAGRSYEALVGVPPANAAAQAAGLLRVVSSDPERSYLLLKLEPPTSATLGARMPLGGAPLSEDQIRLVRDWIAAGAPRNDAVPTSTQPPHTPTSPPTGTSTHTATPTVTPTASLTPTGTVPPSLTPTRTPTTTATATATSTRSVPPTPTFNPDATLARLQETIFTPSCAQPFCHEAAVRAGELAMDPPSTYAEVVGKPPFLRVAAERGLLRVDPGAPDNSFLMTKILLPDFDPELGSPMPLVGPPLTAEQVELIRAWILRGARETE